MQLLQTELAVEYPDLGIQILGVNAIGHESDNADMCEGRDLPWLQDTVELNVWDDVWGVNYRDVYILDAENVLFTVYNVNPSEHNLSDPVHYAGLRAVLLEAAGIVE
jgi:hypothetical protein